MVIVINIIDRYGLDNKAHFMHLQQQRKQK